MRQTDPRLAPQSGSRRGSSAEGQGDVLGRQWILGLRQFLELMPYFSSFLREGELGS